MADIPVVAGDELVNQTFLHPITREEVQVTLSLRDAVYFDLLRRANK